ncbi:hypothetical protein BK403_28025 [Escherichia coli]|uniref:C39 family peptidase n=1 Tax=Escherichia coli TaxID=562 RepID=UPI000928D277|nr:C39 family peptidase [Escherichia coli]OJS43137.1 hypothetical protein BK403_28025 [Escherichia coli]
MKLLSKTVSQLTLTLTMLLIALLWSSAALAQDTPTEVPPAEATAGPAVILPAYHLIQNMSYHAQWWNNCGPATLTSALSHFGYTEDQARAANWLKPNTQDKNVSPWQMAEFVNSQIPEIPVFALTRYGGDLTMLKTLISKDFPVIIEMGYDPVEDDQGWMGHYQLLKGYDDSVGVFITNDSFLGESRNYSYEYITEWWQHFNYVYITLYESGREPELLTLMGENADERQNMTNALQIAANEASLDGSDPYAWFNIGENLTMLGEYERAVQAFDQALTIGLPWRWNWYHFTSLEAYNAVGRYEDTLRLAQANLNDGGGQYVEETFYYAAVAREKLGETQRAIDNYRGALSFNPNFTPAQEGLDRLTQ